MRQGRDEEDEESRKPVRPRVDEAGMKQQGEDGCEREAKGRRVRGVRVGVRLAGDREPPGGSQCGKEWQDTMRVASGSGASRDVVEGVERRRRRAGRASRVSWGQQQYLSLGREGRRKMTFSAGKGGICARAVFRTTQALRFLTPPQRARGL